MKEIVQLGKKEQIKQFFEMKERVFSKEKSLSKDEAKRFLALVDILSMDMFVEKRLDVFKKEIDDDLNHPIVNMEELPNSLFPVLQDKDGKELAKFFYETSLSVMEGEKNAEEQIETFRNEIPVAQVVAYMELLNLAENNYEKYVDRLKELYQLYPDYFMIKMKWYIYCDLTENPQEEEESSEFADLS
ncbi:MAG: hypothetical protein LBH32_09505 [Dysgonamonadaceae bacterium]|nr:hypothetical protein [Dysgonamonadaceae bacterium]